MIHMFTPMKPGLERGISWLAPALTNFYELQGFMEASLVRARTGSLFCGWVRSADGTAILTNETPGETVFEPGSMARLRPGDELQFTNPPDPSAIWIHAVHLLHTARAISSALGLPYELLSGDLSGVTFASGRHSLLAFERTVDSMVQNLVAFQFNRPIWKWWLKIQVAAGELPEEILTAPVRWIAPEFQTLDSRMTVNSQVQKIRAGLVSRSESVSSTGVDPTALDEQIAADNARADKLGLICSARLQTHAVRDRCEGQEAIQWRSNRWPANDPIAYSPARPRSRRRASTPPSVLWG